MDVPPAKEGLTLGATRELLLPATVLVCFLLYYLGHKPFGLIALCAAPMLLLYALAPYWAARSAQSFDRDAVRFLASGRPSALVPRYTIALGMRLFSPSAVSAERKAMALAENGDAEGARAAYLDSLQEYGASVPLRVMLGYAHMSFALGDDAAAIPMYKKLLLSAGTLPGVERNLAHALVRSGQELVQALPMLERAERETHDPARRLELKLIRALAHAKLGDRVLAEDLLGEAEGASGESAELLREEVRALREPVARVLV